MTHKSTSPEKIRQALCQAGETARQEAFDAELPVCLLRNGEVVWEYADGSIATDARKKFDHMSKEMVSLDDEANVLRKKEHDVWKQCWKLMPGLILEENLLQKCQWEYKEPGDTFDQRSYIRPKADNHLTLFNELLTVLRPGNKEDLVGHHGYQPWMTVPEFSGVNLRVDDGNIVIYFPSESHAIRFIAIHKLDVEATQIISRIATLEQDLATLKENLTVFEENANG